MPEIEISIAGRNYRVACGPGEEQHLNAAARVIDIEAEALRRANGAIPESRLMLMSALIIADRLNGTEARLRALEETLQDTQRKLRISEAKLREAAASPPARPRDQANLFADDLAEDAIALLEQTADRLERLADRVAPAD
ncbi:MAG: hypothetical protein KatS3mg118_1132 [Paracoccaceae bacterium]|nr:MAG: cell division protein ZapA [Alphaproteobacteria bacterium]GIX13173.1 MAG: hypothetical protein KatS3mg118_1132 [Paracoccaceae bacterium]